MAIFVVLLFVVLNLVMAVPVAFFMEWAFANSYQITSVVTAGVLCIQVLLEMFGVILFIHAIREEFFR